MGVLDSHPEGVSDQPPFSDFILVQTWFSRQIDSNVTSDQDSFDTWIKMS